MDDPRFLTNGYADMGRLLSSPAPFVFAIGGRGIGKSYGAADWLRAQASGRFCWIRRRENELSTMKAGAPFGNVPSFAGCVWKGTKEATYVRDADGELVCPVLPLATSGKVTGLDLSYVDYAVLDEFIPKPGSRPIESEFEVWSALQETINRNRELEGRPALKMLHISNSETLNSEILIHLELVPVIVRMRSDGMVCWRSEDGLVEIWDYAGSPISEAKRETALYRLISGTEYAQLALDNKFARDDFSSVKRRPLKEYKPLFSVDRRATVYLHKSRDELYVSRHRSGDVPNYPATLAGKRQLYQDIPYIREALAEGVLYESIECKYILESIL